VTDKDTLARHIMAVQLIEKACKSTEERKALAVLLADSNTERVKVEADDGTKLGTVTYVEPKLRAKVSDTDALLSWAKANHPDMVREIVDNAYLTKLLGAAENAGIPVDPSTGELVPGIEMTETTGHVRVNPSKEAKARMAELLEATGLLQLTGPTGTPIETVRDLSEWDDPWAPDEGSTW
jgi:hypothetical protein